MRHRRPECAAQQQIRPRAGWCVHQRLVAAARELTPYDGPFRQLGEVVLADVAREVEEFTVCRRECTQRARKTLARRVGILLHRAQEFRGTARHVDLPQLEAIEFGAIVRRENRLAVRAPCGRGKDRIALARRQLPGIRAVGRDDPEVLGAGSVTDEGDVMTVGGKHRLRIECHAGGEGVSRAAAGVHGEQIAEQLEHDRAAVRGDIRRQPRPLVRVDRDLPCRLQGQRFIRVRSVRRNGCGAHQDRPDRDHASHRLAGADCLSSLAGR